MGRPFLLANLSNLYSVEDTGPDLDQAGIDQRKGRRHDLDIEGPTHDVLCKCAPHLAAGNLVAYSQAFDIRPQLVNNARDFVAETRGKGN
jgi:hypothetical protein